MNEGHDALRQINYLEQCLSSDKRPLALFLGAGCPLAVEAKDGTPLIPDIAGMTDEIKRHLSECKRLGSLLSAIVDQFSKDGRPTPNLEDMLSHIRALKHVAGNEEVRGLSSNDLETLDSAICARVAQVANKPLPDHATPYHSIAHWSSAVQRDYAVEFFTTNYDLLLEQALENCRVTYFDGFAGSHSPFFDIRTMEEDRLPPRWARVWKLHGSLNWYHDPKKGVLRSSITNIELPRVIHPSHLKYEESRRMPYLAMVDRLRTFLKQPSSVLITSGYSFRDQHLNEVITQGLEGSPSAITFGLLFEKLSNYDQAISLAKQRPNFSLLAQDGGVVGTHRAYWAAKEPEFVDSSTAPWITWNSSGNESGGGRLAPRFNLGDFLQLGSLMGSLVESVVPSQGTDDAS